MLERLSAYLEEIARSILPWLEEIVRSISIPPWLKALLVLATGEGDKEEALDVLLSSHAGRLFTRKGLFHPERWRALLREAGGDPVGEAFQNSVCSALILATPRVPLDLSIECWLRRLRNEVRTTIEREWLDGDTLDERLDRKGRAATFPESPEALAVEAELAEEVEERREARMTVRDVLSSLPPDERRIVLWASSGYNLKEIAEMLGINHGAARVRLSRIRQRICAFYVFSV
jgi:RNA polymerase sigma factor (sigma-70 family)